MFQPAWKRQELAGCAFDVFPFSCRLGSSGSTLNIPRPERFLALFRKKSVRSFMILKEWKRNEIRGYPESMTSEDAVNILKHSSHHTPC